MRPKTCENIVRSWRELYGSELSIIVIDDGKKHPNFVDDKNTHHEILPFDMGASYGRNLGTKLAQTEFIFISDDDNSPPNPKNLSKCFDLITKNNIDILGFEAYKLEVINKNAIIKQQIISNDFLICDFTAVHFLAKKSRLLSWNESLKIDGEHFDYFMRCRKQNIIVAGTELLSYNRILKESVKEINSYLMYRRRKKFKEEAKKIWDIDDIFWINNNVNLPK